MYYFLHGDANKIFKKSQTTAAALLKKKPEASIFKINNENFSIDLMTEMIGGQGLFENKYIIQLSRILENQKNGEIVLGFLEHIKESKNIFIWVEEDVKKPILKKVGKHAAKVEFSEEIKKAKAKMNIFDLANAFGEKDKKRVWVLYQKALKEYSPEEIYGTLWWQVKSMLISSKTNNAKEAGMKDFPYKKAKQYCTKYSAGEAEALASELIKVYHHSRVNGEDINQNLEKFILTY
jgi:hypothetical protein